MAVLVQEHKNSRLRRRTFMTGMVRGTASAANRASTADEPAPPTGGAGGGPAVAAEAIVVQKPVSMAHGRECEWIRPQQASRRIY